MIKKFKFASVILLFSVQFPSYANTNMTNNPVSNSSGSVTNLGVMNMPTRQFQNQVGLQTVVCQSDTMVIQPFVTSSASFTKPFQDFYLDPIYSVKDTVGAFDANGNAIGDGDPDNAGQIIGYRTVRTAQKDTYNISPGISLSWNISLDRKAVRLCREAQQRQSDLIKARVNDNMYALELGRLKTCGDLLSKGYNFKKSSKYYKLCEDIELTNPSNTLINHQHSLNSKASVSSNEP